MYIHLNEYIMFIRQYIPTYDDYIIFIKHVITGQMWTNGSKLCDLDYTDDIMLIDTSRDRMQTMTKAVENEGRKVRLTMNDKKCKVMVSNAWEDSN